MSHPSERLDRTAHFASTHAEASARARRARLALSPIERLEAAWIRTCRVYGIDPRNCPPMDRRAFAMRKQPS